MTEEQAKELLRNHKAICNFWFYRPDFLDDMNPNSEYSKTWLWHDQSGDIWMDLQEALEIERLTQNSPGKIDPVYIQKWLRMYLKKRPTFDFDNLRDELYEEIERLINNLFSAWFRYYPNGTYWNVCDMTLNPKSRNCEDRMDILILQNDYHKFLNYFNLDIWKKVIQEYKIPVLTPEKAAEYERTIAEQKERILALESELMALQKVTKIENHINQLNMGNGIQSTQTLPEAEK